MKAFRHGCEHSNRSGTAESLPTELPKQYDHAQAQQRWYPFWLERGYFHNEPDPTSRAGKAPYTIVIPPPNVTGALHLGHALNNTLQDILDSLASGCRASTSCGCREPIMPASPPRRSSSGGCWKKKRKRRHDLGRDEAGRADLGLEERIRSPHPRPAQADGL